MKLQILDSDIRYQRDMYKRSLKTETQASESVRDMWRQLVAMLDELLRCRRGRSPRIISYSAQSGEITTEETKQRIDEWREQREKYNDEVEFLRVELQAYREALCSMAAAIQSLDLESDYYVDSRRHPTVKSKLTSVLSDVEALLAKGDKK